MIPRSARIWSSQPLNEGRNNGNAGETNRKGDAWQGVGHSAIYEKGLARLWPLNEKDREAKIAQFATQYGFRLRFYSKGMYAIFDKSPPPNGQMMDAPVTPKE
jgi:hypothetical protein